MRRWEPFPEEKGRCVKGGVVGPSGVSAAPERAGRGTPLQALPCPRPSLNRSARCGRCSCLLRGPGPQGKTRCSFSPCLGVLTGPGGGCVELNSGCKASLEQVGGGSSPPSPVCAQLQEVTKPVRPPHRPLLAWPPSEGCRRGRPSGCLRPDMPRGCWVPRAWHLGGSPKLDRGPGGEASG